MSQPCQVVNDGHEGEVEQVTLEVQPAVLALDTPIVSKAVWLCAAHRVPPTSGFGDIGEGIPARITQSR